jgi:hypothetical protein
MDEKNDDLRKIMNGGGDFPNKEMEKNYNALRELILQFKKGRGWKTHQIDHIETSDLAWNLAEYLPDGVVIKANESRKPALWSWMDSVMIVLTLAGIGFLIYLTILNL